VIYPTIEYKATALTEGIVFIFKVVIILILFYLCSLYITIVQNRELLDIIVFWAKKRALFRRNFDILGYDYRYCLDHLLLRIASTHTQK